MTMYGAEGGGYVEALQKALGQNRQVVSLIDEFRASTSVQVILSGASYFTSGQTVYSVVTSSVVRIRPLNMHLQNRESSHMTVVFRDGGISGAVVAGPFIVNPIQERVIQYPELAGRFFTSSIYAVVLSGAFAAGISLDVGYVLDPQEYYE